MCFKNLAQNLLKLKDRTELGVFLSHLCFPPFILQHSFLCYMTALHIWPYSLLRFQGPI